MNLIPVNIDSLPLGKPLPFALRSAEGGLLAPRGYIIRNRTEVETLIARGVQLCMDTAESADNHRRYVAQLGQMLRDDQPLGQIATMKIAIDAPARADALADGLPDWHELEHFTSQLLRHPQDADFRTRLQALANTLQRHATHTPDATLLALIWLSGQGAQRYSALHALLVAVMCMLTAHETLRWPEEEVHTLGCAALTMNLAMTALQDELARQPGAPDATQIDAIHGHAQQSAALLRSLGITDARWLQAVAMHHQHASGPLAAQEPAHQMARLLQRADVFAARLAPRATRHALTATAAVKASYYDDQGQVDDAGAALVRTLGMYPPGSLVRLANQEIAIVLRRGSTATAPRVAVLIGRSGMPTGEPIPRDTHLGEHKVAAALTMHKVRLQVSLQRLIKLP